MVAPVHPIEVPLPYTRRPIDYTSLDSVGLGGYKEPRVVSLRPRSMSMRSVDHMDPARCVDIEYESNPKHACFIVPFLREAERAKKTGFQNVPNLKLFF